MHATQVRREMHMGGGRERERERDRERERAESREQRGVTREGTLRPSYNRCGFLRRKLQKQTEAGGWAWTRLQVGYRE